MGLSLALSLSLIPAYSATPPKAGSVCSKQGITKIYQGKRFTCIKLGKSLYWDKGKRISSLPTPTPIPTYSPTTPSTPSEVPWEACREGVLIRDLRLTNQVIRGQNIEVSVDASSACNIDEVNVSLVAKVNGDVVNVFGDWAKRIAGTKASGTWSFSLGTSERTAEMKLDVILTFYSCENKESPRRCIASKSPFDEYEVCSSLLRYRACQASRQIEILAPAKTLTLPNINTAILAGDLYCGITNSEAWDYKVDNKKSNVISALSWVFPDGDATVWDRKWENWAEGTLSSGIRYRISSNIEYWGGIGGLPTLRLSLLDASGKQIRIESSEFRGKKFVCRFETSVNGKTLRTEGPRLIP